MSVCNWLSPANGSSEPTNQPMKSRAGCAQTPNFTFKRGHGAQVNACDVSDAAQVLGQCKSATSAQILGFNSREPFDLLSRNFALKCNMTANHIRPWLRPHTLTSTKRTSKLLAPFEVQVCQLIQILERLKIACFSQSRESLVVPLHPTRNFNETHR